MSQPPDPASQDPGRPVPPPEPDAARPFGARRATENDAAYVEIYDSPEFSELRRRFRRLVLPLVVGFLAWYFLYVLLATYAHGFMAHEVAGRVNVGLVFGLLQFVSTFGIAWYYSRRADRDVDPLSAELRTRYTARVAAAPKGPTK